MQGTKPPPITQREALPVGKCGAHGSTRASPLHGTADTPTTGGVMCAADPTDPRWGGWFVGDQTDLGGGVAVGALCAVPSKKKNRHQPPLHLSVRFNIRLKNKYLASSQRL